VIIIVTVFLIICIFILCVTCRYYEFDSVIVREILGKKLTSRFRNALDDISDKMHVPLRSCRRQVQSTTCWKVLESSAFFSGKISRIWKVVGNDFGPGKS